MGKIRINELARQLEVPSHAIIDMLPELGVTEKKTHSSSVDEPVAEVIRQRVHGGGSGTAMRPADTSFAVADFEPIETPVRHEPSAPPAAIEHPTRIPVPDLETPVAS